MGVESIIMELDYLYQYDMDKYLTECSDFKRFGYKIYRNSEGKHKVIEPHKNKPQNVNIFEAFGGIFGDIFN